MNGDAADDPEDEADVDQPEPPMRGGKPQEPMAGPPGPFRPDPPPLSKDEDA